MAKVEALRYQSRCSRVCGQDRCHSRGIRGSRIRNHGLDRRTEERLIPLLLHLDENDEADFNYKLRLAKFSKLVRFRGRLQPG